MRGAYVVLAPAADVHAQAVWRALEARVGADRCAIVDVALHPSQFSFDTKIGAEGLNLSLPDLEVPFSPSAIRAIWRRRIFAPLPDPALVSSEDREIAISDARATREGFFLTLCRSGVRLVNDPLVETPALNKAYQLAVAQQGGMRIPETLITSCPNSAAAFCRTIMGSGRRVAFKGFVAPKGRLISTQIFEESDFDDLPLLRHSPSIFQEYIEGRNLRVTVVGRRVFAAEVLVKIPEAERDWRMEAANTVVPFELSADRRESILDLMAQLNLEYAALDLKLTRNDSMVFLEANPWGQYLFVEIQTGLAISEAIADLLLS